MHVADEPLHALNADPVQARLLLARWSFVHSIDDISRRLEPATTRYDVVGIAAVLRRLFIDRGGVEAIVRKGTPGIPSAAYEFTPYELSPDSKLPDGRRFETIFSLNGVGFDQPTTTGARHDFLSAPIGQYLQDPISVHDVINVYANVLGGVHVGTPADDAQEFHRALLTFNLTRTDIWARALQSIGRVAVKALQPSADAVRPLLGGWNE